MVDSKEASQRLAVRQHLDPAAPRTHRDPRDPLLDKLELLRPILLPTVIAATPPPPPAPARLTESADLTTYSCANFFKKTHAFGQHCNLRKRGASAVRKEAPSLLSTPLRAQTTATRVS